MLSMPGRKLADRPPASLRCALSPDHGPRFRGAARTARESEIASGVHTRHGPRGGRRAAVSTRGLTGAGRQQLPATRRQRLGAAALVERRRQRGGDRDLRHASRRPSRRGRRGPCRPVWGGLPGSRGSWPPRPAAPTPPPACSAPRPGEGAAAGRRGQARGWFCRPARWPPRRPALQKCAHGRVQRARPTAVRVRIVGLPGGGVLPSRRRPTQREPLAGGARQGRRPLRHGPKAPRPGPHRQDTPSRCGAAGGAPLAARGDPAQRPRRATTRRVHQARVLRGVDKRFRQDHRVALDDRPPDIGVPRAHARHTAGPPQPRGLLAVP